MAVTKLSIALDEQVAGAARAAAAREGVSLSAWLSRAAEQAVLIDDGLRAVAEWEADNSALTPDERSAADKLLDAMASDRASAVS